MNVQLLILLSKDDNTKVHAVRGEIPDFSGVPGEISAKFMEMQPDLFAFKGIMDGDLTAKKDVAR